MNMWMNCPGTEDAPCIVCFRLEIDSPDGHLDFEYSADETAQIFVDGQLADYGPGRGSENIWFRQRFSRETTPGRHVIVARVLQFGAKLTARSQISLRHGFYCSLEGRWLCRKQEGASFAPPWPDWGVYPRLSLDAMYDYSAETGGGEWCEPEYFEDGRELHLSELPPLLGKRISPESVTDGVVRFSDYECVWPIWHFAGEGVVSIRWGECGYLTGNFNRHTLKGEKGRRDGECRVGDFDTFQVAGECTFTDFQWRAGRYAEIHCTGTARVERMEFIRTGYPYKFRFKLDDAPEKWRGALRMALRSLECCSHDLFMDCPFYERLMYIGDARIEALCSYAAAGDDTLPKRALRFFASSQKENGAILSRFPAQVEQIIPSFVAIFILMLHDHWIWNRNLDFLREMLPAARKTMVFLLSRRADDGLLHIPGWNFIDWQWPSRGVPFGSECGTNSIINLMAVLALQKMAEMEDAAGSGQATIWSEAEQTLFQQIERVYYNREKQLFSDDKEHLFYSEHAQVLAMLCRRLPHLWDGLESCPKITSCGIYFSHFYLEACRLYGKMTLLEKRFQQYAELESLGLKTLPEEFIFPRSDCHAWGSHILYHWLMLR